MTKDIHVWLQGYQTRPLNSLAASSFLFHFCDYCAHINNTTFPFMCECILAMDFQAKLALFNEFFPSQLSFHAIHLPLGKIKIFSSIIIYSNVISKSCTHNSMYGKFCISSINIVHNTLFSFSISSNFIGMTST